MCITYKIHHTALLLTFLSTCRIIMLRGEPHEKFLPSQNAKGFRIFPTSRICPHCCTWITQKQFLAAAAFFCTFSPSASPAFPWSSMLRTLLCRQLAFYPESVSLPSASCIFAAGAAAFTSFYQQLCSFRRTAQFQSPFPGNPGCPEQSVCHNP